MGSDFIIMLHKHKLLASFLTLTGIFTGTFILLSYRLEFQRKAKYVRKASDRRQMAFQTKSSCPRDAESSETPRFVEVEKGTLVYSAWFDDRQEQTYIRILLMTWRRDNPPPVFCRFHSELNSKSSARIASTYYEINKGHELRYGLYVVSCVVHDELTIPPPSFVEISIELSPEKPNNIVLPVGNTCIKRERGSFNDTGRREYGICIPTLFGDISVIR